MFDRLNRLRSKTYQVLTSKTGNALPPVKLGKKAALYLNDLVGQPLADQAELERRAAFEARRRGSGFEPVTMPSEERVPVVLFHKGEQREVASIQKLLDEEKIAFDLRNVEDDLPTIEALHRESGGRPLPVVFIAGTPIGGADAIRRLIKTGELARLVSSRQSPIGQPAPDEGPLGDPSAPAQVFGTEGCPWTGRSRALLEREGVAYRFVDLDSREGIVVADRLVPETGHNTQPWIFVRGKFVGGYNALDEITRLGQLGELSRDPAQAHADPRVKVVIAERENTDEVAPADSEP